MKHMKQFIFRMRFTAALKKVLFISSILGLYTALIVALKIPMKELSSLGELETIFGLVIGLILLFRANRAYERWWEARSLWGTLINASQNLAIKIKTLLPADSASARNIAKKIPAFAFSLNGRLQLSASHKTKETREPTTIVTQIYAALHTLQESGHLQTTDMWLIDQELRNFLIIAGGCERIKGTLISPSFRSFSRQIIFVFLLCLPFIFIPGSGYYSVIFTAFSSYIVFGLEGIAANLEEPFGDTDDHLELDAMCETIQTSVTKIIDQN